MGKNSERLVVKSYHPSRERQRILLTAGFVIISFFVGLLLGGKWFDVEMVEKRALDRMVIEKNAQMRIQQHQLSAAQLASEVDKGALETVRLELSHMQQILADNTNELTLYRSLLQKENAGQGLLISDFSLVGNEAGDYGYQLILQQRAGKLKTIKVTATFVVDGEQSGQSVSLEMPELDSEQEKSTMGLEFRYFYVHEGIIKLPADFKPLLVRVKIWPVGQSRKVIEREFPWQLESGRNITIEETYFEKEVESQKVEL